MSELIKVSNGYYMSPRDLRKRVNANTWNSLFFNMLDFTRKIVQLWALCADYAPVCKFHALCTVVQSSDRLIASYIIHRYSFGGLKLHNNHLDDNIYQIYPKRTRPAEMLAPSIYYTFGNYGII